MAPAPTEIYTLSLHDALPIYAAPTALGEINRNRVNVERWDWRFGNRLRFTASYSPFSPWPPPQRFPPRTVRATVAGVDRKSTRLNSSHSQISYAVFCLKKKTK